MLTTQPLAITAICPGSSFTVPFSSNSIGNLTNTVLTVQVSDGGDYKDIPSKGPYVTSGVPITATIPADIAPNRLYSVRIKATNPDVIGIPSSTQLYIRGREAKPPVPLVDSLTVDCMSTNQSSMAGLYAYLNFKLVAGATPRLHFNDQWNQFRDYAEFPYVVKQSNGDYVPDRQSGYFQLNKISLTSPTYVYPVYEHTYSITQSIDGCESEPVAAKLRIIWKAGGGPGPLNPLPNAPIFGQVTYCQGEQAYPLNVNGHRPPPENFQVTYAVGGFQSANPTTLIPPIPDTSTPGLRGYVLNLVPIDPRKGCANQNYLTFTYLNIIVNPTPPKPIAPTGLIEYYQGQLSAPLTASTIDSSATLVWYDTQATSGTGSATAPQPATKQSGEFTYYVAQKVGTCESERTPIMVRINPLLGLDDAWLGAHSQVYPNPVSARLTVKVSGISAQQPALLELMDLTGRSLLRHTSPKEACVLALDNYATGSYFLLIRVGNRQTVKRIVKQ
ncbi:T9SS type A sorting domain-containing protein [Spirosoma flavum]|uniref:T9SS type A sorting domain-containing protein n=1 Tax=Spirosoma flavum TaxID=2048557 RepID=A0ABW6AFZ5_9BACT